MSAPHITLPRTLPKGAHRREAGHATPHSEAEMAKLPVHLKLILRRDDYQRIIAKGRGRKMTTQGILRHLLLTHPMMMEGNKP